MTEKELAAELKGNFTKGFAGRYGKLIAENDLFGFALNLGLDRDPAVAFHASYALERAFFIAPEAFGRHIGHFVRNYLAIVNPSACRHYSKMMAWLLDRYTETEQAEITSGTVYDWGRESAAASKCIYDVQPGESVANDFIKKYKPLAESQIAKAGYRLAAVLNDVFGK